MTEGTLLCVGEGLFELGIDGGTLRQGIGGDAANAAVMAARLGASTRLLGRVGDDELGRRLLAFWRSAGVQTTDVRVDARRPTGIYVNRKTRSGHQFDYHRSGSAGSALDEAQVAQTDFGGVGCVHYTGVALSVSQGSAAACSAARDRAGTVSFAANVRPRLAPDMALLRAHALAADIVFCSDEDAALLFGDVGTALATVAGRPVELIVTLGEEGAICVTDTAEIRERAPHVDVVDAAGAGDALAGAYLAARLRNESPARALEGAVVAAALSCTATGCALSYPTAAAVRAALESTGRMKR